MSNKTAVVVLVLLAGIMSARQQLFVSPGGPGNLPGENLMKSKGFLGTGGPDEYGYRWIDSDTVGGPVYNWVDITSTGVEVTGLADDNVVGPFNIGFDFPFYWYKVNRFWINSNGVISFSSNWLWIPYDGGSIIPNPILPNDVVAPLGGDLNFALGRGRVYYYTNNRDSLVVSFIDVPEWHYGSDTAGSHTFQLILYKGDSSITFQYGPQRGFFQYGYPGIVPACGIGIENATGQIGLQYLLNNNPTQNLYEDSLAILFYPPDTTELQIRDIGVLESANEGNMGFFLMVGDTFRPYMIVENTGNQDVGCYSVCFRIKRLPGTYVYVDSVVGGPLAVGARDTLLFSPWVPSEITKYMIRSKVQLIGDMLPSNDSVIVDMRTTPVEGWLTYLNDTVNFTLYSWLTAWGGYGARFTPPYYPCDVESVALLLSTGGMGTADAILMVMDDDGPDGMPGTILLQDTVTVADTLEWYFLTIEPGQIVISEGSFYVGFIQLENRKPSLAFDYTPPVSRQAMEYTGTWAPYRLGDFVDPAIKVYIKPKNVETDEKMQFASKADDMPRVLSLTPGIARDYLKVVLSSPGLGDISIDLYDVSGKLVKSVEKVDLSPGKNELTIDTSGLPDGVYFLSLRKRRKDISARFVVLH